MGPGGKKILTEWNAEDEDEHGDDVAVAAAALVVEGDGAPELVRLVTTPSKHGSWKQF